MSKNWKVCISGIHRYTVKAPDRKEALELANEWLEKSGWIGVSKVELKEE